MTAADSSLVVDAIALDRGGRTLVSDLSLRLVPGQLALVTGPNGAGKTTLLRALAGLAPPAAGSIRYGDQSVGRLSPEQRVSIAYHGHLDGLKKDLTVEENILFISQLRGYHESISSIVQALELGPLVRRTVRQLSAGQKRRTALATLAVSGAALWLLDEPLTNLDAAGRALVLRWIDQHLARQGMAVVATHVSEELKRPGCLLVEL